MEYQKLTYNSWNDFKSQIATDLCRQSLFPSKQFIFRGQRNAAWPLKSSFDRMFEQLTFATRNRIEHSLNGYFRENCIELIEDTSFEEYDDSQLLTLAQHYGLPTRLLDWSYSIYVAAFFFFVYNKNDNSDYIAIWVIDTNHEIWNADYGVDIITSRIKENTYQKNQKGIFTKNNSPAITLEEYVKSCEARCDTHGALTRITIPFEERNSVLSDLEMMGINHMRLFSGFEGCAQSAIVKAFVDHNLT